MPSIKRHRAKKAEMESSIRSVWQAREGGCVELENVDGNEEGSLVGLHGHSAQLLHARVDQDINRHCHPGSPAAWMSACVSIAIATDCEMPRHSELNALQRVTLCFSATQELQASRAKFCKSQQGRIDELWKFVQEQRIRRRQVTAQTFHMQV